ncbi:hypothetical protein ACFLUD_00800 [Chloroflexota bacterium]
MIKRYEHTQVDYLIIAAMAAVMVLIGVVLANAGTNWIAIGVLVVIVVALVLFSSLTVVIWEVELEVRFGLGPIRKRFKLNEIESCQVVKNHTENPITSKLCWRTPRLLLRLTALRKRLQGLLVATITLVAMN